MVYRENEFLPLVGDKADNVSGPGVVKHDPRILINVLMCSRMIKDGVVSLLSDRGANAAQLEFPVAEPRQTSLSLSRSALACFPHIVSRYGNRT